MRPIHDGRLNSPPKKRLRSKVTLTSRTERNATSDSDGFEFRFLFVSPSDFLATTIYYLGRIDLMQTTLDPSLFNVRIRRFQSRDLEAVIKVFVAGQESYCQNVFHQKQHRSYVSTSLKSDLSSVEALEKEFFGQSGSYFWVATIAKCSIIENPSNINTDIGYRDRWKMKWAYAAKLWVQQFESNKAESELCSDETVVGTVAVSRRNSAEAGIFGTKDDFFGELRRMAVDSSMQGCSLGSNLGLIVEEFCRLMKYKCVFLTTLLSMEPACRLYQNLGFKCNEVSDLKLYIKGCLGASTVFNKSANFLLATREPGATYVGEAALQQKYDLDVENWIQTGEGENEECSGTIRIVKFVKILIK